MATNGEEGLKLMLAKPAHLIISDVNMPKLDGLGFLRAVRCYEATRKVGFILLSGKGDKDLIDRAAKYGVSNVIAKPFTMPVLKQKIEAVVGKLK
jgi:two-component system, chemotaxis family, chemotaxis protein CheY